LTGCAQVPNFTANPGRVASGKLIKLMKTVSTPGPWQATQFLDCAQQFKISDTSGFLIANVGIQHLHARENENSANAHLIAAAPELLAALKSLTHPDGLSSLNMLANMQAARVAIAKAEGLA